MTPPNPSSLLALPAALLAPVLLFAWSISAAATAQTPSSAQPLASGNAAGPGPSKNPPPAASLPTYLIDPQLQPILDTLHALHPRPLETLTPGEARNQPTLADAAALLLKQKGLTPAARPLASVLDRSLLAPPAASDPSHEIPLRLYTPPGPGPFPVTLYFHPGGFVLGSLDTADTAARALAALTPSIVVSVGYRLAPEHPYPAARNDAYAAYLWTLANAASFHGDPARIAVAGEEAGGNLALVTSLLARDRHQKIPIAQVLIDPIVDDDTTTSSYTEFATDPPPTRARMIWFFNQLNADTPPGAAPSAPVNRLIDPYRNPYYATVENLPPTSIIAAYANPLKTEGFNLASKLAAFKIPLHYSLYMGEAAGFFSLTPLVDKAAKAQQRAADALNESFRPRSISTPTVDPLQTPLRSNAPSPKS